MDPATAFGRLISSDLPGPNSPGSPESPEVPEPAETPIPTETPTKNDEEPEVSNDYLAIPPSSQIKQRFLINWYQNSPKECKKYLDPYNIEVACKKLGFVVEKYESSIPRLGNEWIPERKNCFRYPPVLAVMRACVRMLHYEYETGQKLFPPLPDLGVAGEHDVDLVEFGCEARDTACGHVGKKRLLPESDNLVLAE